MSFIDFNDNSIPIGKRKQAYVKWAVKNGTDITKAKRQANKKFGFEQKPGIFALCIDHGRTCQASYTGRQEIFQGIDLRKYEKSDYKIIEAGDNVDVIKTRIQAKGWDFILIDLIP